MPVRACLCVCVTLLCKSTTNIAEKPVRVLSNYGNTNECWDRVEYIAFNWLSWSYVPPRPGLKKADITLTAPHVGDFSFFWAAATRTDVRKSYLRSPAAVCRVSRSIPLTLDNVTRVTTTTCPQFLWTCNVSLRYVILCCPARVVLISVFCYVETVFYIHLIVAIVVVIMYAISNALFL